ncbi:ribosome biogenesis protein BRX1 homolog [Heptranchias perlo]|uniref:ribosome biogenesis protein BRX1 homolog n=1 Tax=Heptranchias perlo TaxID=212740 RepID=UPI00355A67F3
MVMAAAEKRGPGKRARVSGREAQSRPGESRREGQSRPGDRQFTVPAPVSMGKWKNKERVLIFSSRGISYRTRHLMQDLRTLMPHSKPDTKMDRKDKLFVINEVRPVLVN